MSTVNKILEALAHYNLKRESNVKYRCNSPLRAGSDSMSFSLLIEGDEHGTYFDHVSHEHGSLYQLADVLGIARPEHDTSADSGKVAYRNLEHYAQMKNIPVKAFEDAGWYNRDVYGRSAVVYPTATGERVRFLDAGTPKYMPLKRDDETGTRLDCFYGLERAIQMSSDNTIYCVNGEASVIVCHHYGIPAFCVTGGEKPFAQHLIEELVSKWQGVIAYVPDNDDKGRDTVQARVQQVGGVIVNLGLGINKADIADFCTLYGHSAYSELKRLTPRKQMQSALSFDSFVGLDDTSAIMSAVLSGDDSALSFMPKAVSITWDVLQPMIGNHMASGKVAGLISSSGAGKTIALETLVFHNIIRGIPTLFVSPEWSPMELHFRMLLKNWQGYDAPNYEQFLAWLDAKRLGDTSARIQGHEQLMAHMKHWKQNGLDEPLRFFNIKQAKTTNIRQVLQHCQDEMIKFRKRHGVDIEMVVFDYVSVFDSEDKTNNEHEAKLNAFKEFVMVNDVAGVTTSQVNKDAVRRVHEYGGHYVASDGYGIREDKFNYIITATPHMVTYGDASIMHVRNMGIFPNHEDGKAHHPYKDANGITVKTGNVLYHTAKNSVKSAERKSWAHFDYSRLRVMSGVNSKWREDNNGGIEPNY